MDLERAEKIASEVVKRLSPYCQRIEVCGSVRRQKATVHDVDIVLIPSDPWNLEHEILGLAHPFRPQLSGEKLKRFSYNGVQVDLYYASEETWAMLLLVRTGSAAHNQRLATRAKQLGLHFAADGRGILRDGNPVAWRSEEEIFEALGLAYKEPWTRE